jgi:hypothetical protein
MSNVVEQNTLKRRGVGLRACDPERACPGFTLFAPVFEQNRTVYLIDLQGEVVHTWQLPYAPQRPTKSAGPIRIDRFRISSHPVWATLNACQMATR